MMILSSGDSSGTADYDAAYAIMLIDEPNVEYAFELLQRSLKRGNRDAAYALGTWYSNGKAPVVEIDSKKAFELFNIAAKAGHRGAFYDLGVMYKYGNGCAVNLRLAAENFLRAALMGDVGAIGSVSRCYYEGNGVAQDEGIADIWAARADELELELGLDVNAD